MGSNLLTMFEAAIFLDLALGVVILAKNYREFVNRLFFYFSVLMACWIFTNLMVTLSTTAVTGLVWYRLTYVTAAPMIYFLYLFTCSFPNIFVKNKYLLYLPVVPTLLVALASLTPWVIRSVDISDGNFSFTNGPGFYAFVIFAVALVFASLGVLVKQRQLSSGIVRQQVKYIFVGIALGSIFALLTDLVLPLVGFDRLANTGSVGVIALSVGIAYAIVRAQLFDIKVLLTEAAVILVVGTTLTQTFSVDRSELIPRLILLAVMVYGGIILIKSVREEVSRREEIEKLAGEKTAALGEVEERNKNLATLQRISDIVLNESEMKVMAQKILDEIPKQLESCAGAMLSVVKDSQLVAYALSQHQFSAKILSLVGGDLEKYSFPVKKDFNLSHAVLVDKEPHDSGSLSDFISPPISKAVALTIQKMIGARHIEAFPLYAGGEPFGVMMFVFTESKDRVHEQNHSIAKAISDDMSLAIQRAQAYQKLKEANAYLADLDKLKDEFISMASHELNTPLAAIEGYLSMVLDEGLGKVDPKAKEYLNRAYDSSKRLAELILDLLNVSRIEQGRLKMKFTKTNFASLVDSVIKELQLKADTKKLYLKLETSKTELPETFCDPDRIREVFVNLIGNSIKFTDKGGITIKLSKPDDHIRAEVVDTGRGIAEADQKLLFQKFSQVKREIDEHQGTGLGLYISKNFVELHKGRIGVTSEQGKGATFFFEIPIMKSAPKEVAGAMLDKPVNAAQIETGPKGVPAIVAESSKTKA